MSSFGFNNFGSTTYLPLDPNNPYYQIDMKYSGVIPGTYGNEYRIPLFNINDKGFVTGMSVTGGISIPEMVSDFTIKGLNSVSNPLYTNLESYTPNRYETANGSGFIGNYGFTLYNPASVATNQAVGSFCIGVSNNAKNSINTNNFSIGNYAMSDSLSSNAVTIGHKALQYSNNNNMVYIGHSETLTAQYKGNFVTIGNNNKNTISQKTITIGSKVQLRPDYYTEGGSYNYYAENVTFGTNSNIYPSNGSIAISTTPNYNGSSNAVTNSLYQSILMRNVSLKQNETVNIISNSLTDSVVIGNSEHANTNYSTFRSQQYMLYQQSTLVGYDPRIGYVWENCHELRTTSLGNSLILNANSFSLDFQNKPYLTGTIISDGSAGIGNSNMTSNFSISLGTNAGYFLTGPTVSYSNSFINGQTQIFNLLEADSVATMIAMGGSTTIILSNSGKAYLFGENFFNVLGDGSENADTFKVIPWTIDNRCSFVNISHGMILFITNSGALYGIGMYENFEFINSITLIDNGPWKDAYLTNELFYYAKDDIRLINYNIFGMKTDNGIYITGSNKYGQLANGTSGDNGTSRFSFVRIGTDTYKKVVGQGCGFTAINYNNRAFRWGKFGSISNNTLYPLVNDNLPNFDVIDIEMDSTPTVVAIVRQNALILPTVYYQGFAGNLGSSKFVTFPNVGSASNVRLVGRYNYIFTIKDLAGNVKHYNGFLGYTILPAGSSIGALYQSADTRKTASDVIVIETLNNLKPVILQIGSGSADNYQRFTNAYFDINQMPNDSAAISYSYGSVKKSEFRICLGSRGSAYYCGFFIGDETYYYGNTNGTGVETSASSGGASSLPSSPAAYLRTHVNLTKYKMPLYNL